MMCVLGLFTVNAQNLSIVEIGADKNPDAINGYNLPVSDYASYAISQQIYTAEEMGDNTGAIMTVGFKLGNSTSAQTRKYEVYLKSTELDEFDVTHYIDLDEADKVFDGDVEISGEMDSWFTITLDKAFNYTGGNILLAVYDKTGVGLNDYHFFYKYAASGRALYSKGNYSYDMLNLGTSLAISYVNQIQFGMATGAAVAVSTESVALGNVKVGEYWAEESAAKSATFNIQANATLVTSVSCDNDFFILEHDLTVNPIVVKVGYDKTAEAGEQTATITIKANNVEDITIPVTATAYAPAEADVYELAKEITFTAGSFTDTPSNLNDDYNLPNEVNNGITPDAVYSFELEEELTVVVDVTGKNAVAAIYAEDFAGKGGPKADNNYGGIVPAKTTFFFDFNDGSLEAFNLRDDDNDGKNWGISSGKLMSYSWISGHGNITPDNYVFTKEAYAITDASKVTYKVNAVAKSTDYYAVVVSEDGENFNIVFEEGYNQTAQADKEVDLSAYAGKVLYIGFRHFNCTGQYHIDIDDFRLTDGSGMTRGENAEPQIKVSYPAGKYYLVAAAEDQFTVNVSLDIAPPAAPENVSATPVDETTITLTWDAVEDVDSYNIYQNEEFLTTVASDVTSYTIENLDANTQYCYIVTSVDYTMESFKTAVACAKTSDYVIAAPANVAVTAVDEFSVKLTWDAVEHAQSYNIYVGENVISTKETAYAFEDLMPNTEYCYEVTAVRNEQETAKVKACGKTEAIDFDAEDLATEFFFDFNDQSMEDFMLLDADNDGNNWTIAKDNNSANEDEYILKSYSDGVTATDNYIYTKRPYRITKSSVVSLDARSGTGGMDAYKGEHYAVVVSENGADWTVVFEETIDTTVWVSSEVSLAEYAGKGVLVGIRHYNSKVYFLSVDNFRLSQVVVPEAPEAPVVTATASSSSTIALTWAAVEGATSYKVYQGEEVLATVTETTYTVTGLEAEKEYCFNVTAINEVGESAKSENACATTLEEGNDPIAPEPEAPSAPKVKAEATSDTTIVLTWNSVMTATSFKVYQGEEVIATVTETTYTVSGLTANTEYCFAVTAINENGESAKSVEVCATTKPDAISELEASFNVYPNPVNDKLYIETETEIKEVVVYDVYGRVQNLSNSATQQLSNSIDVTDLNSGVYFVKVVTENGEAVQRFIKK